VKWLRKLFFRKRPTPYAEFDYSTEIIEDWNEGVALERERSKNQRRLVK
jgi:hypothetical protein